MAIKPMQSSALIGIGALAVWGASRMAWLGVEAYDDKSGSKSLNINGAMWSTETTAVALVLLAACVASFALRRSGRRLVGIISGLAAAGGAWSPIQLMTTDPDRERVLKLLTSESASGHQKDGAALTGWSEIMQVTTHAPAAALAIIGCAIALFGGVVLAMNPGKDSARKNRYERKQERSQKIHKDLKDAPDSGRVLWDAIDADIDPTVDRGRG
ncbi:TIGR02234 family membrane protein [Corynebacterium pseudotuberculosis]|uniref:TIGR02234 family membrane protein n=1 Tax=Corynebacterium pseudotuberculosis TaxID=1719 RepID=UPI0034E196D4